MKHNTIRIVNFFTNTEENNFSTKHLSSQLQTFQRVNVTRRQQHNSSLILIKACLNNPEHDTMITLHISTISMTAAGRYSEFNMWMGEIISDTEDLTNL